MDFNTKQITTIAAIALFAPWASAQYTYTDVDGTDVTITGQVSGNNAVGSDLVADINTALSDAAGLTQYLDGLQAEDILSLSAGVGNNNAVLISQNNGINANSGDIATNTTAITFNSDGIVQAISLVQASLNNNATNGNNIAANTASIAINNATNAGDIATLNNLIERQGDTIHIGNNSFILDDTAGNHVLTTDDGSFTLGGGAVLEVEVDGRLDVSGNLEIGAIPDVESAITANTGAVATNAASITTIDEYLTGRAVDIVLNAYDINTLNNLIERQGDTIHIGNNSFILDDTAGNHVLTTDDGSFTLGGGAVLEVEVDGRLDVSGNLEIGAIPDVESAINNNFSNITVNSVISGINVGNITANTGAITTLNDDATVEGSVAHSINALATGAVATNTGAVATNTGNIGANTGSITTLNDDATVTGSVANSIAAAISDLGTSANGIAGLIERKNINGESVIQLGANTFFFNDATDTISTTSGNINLDADVAITGDLEVAGDVFVGGRSIGLQSQINSNRLDIDRNARGIAMVAALQHTTVLPGMTNALDVSAAHFEGETGMALNYSRRINENVQINFGAAATSDFDESVIKAGLGVQW